MKRLKVLGDELKLRWSPTFMQKAACPAFLRFRYIVKPDDHFVRLAAERGKAAHAAIADLIELCIAEERVIDSLSDDEVIRAIKKHTPANISTEFGHIVQWLELWRERFKLPSDISGVEERIALDDNFDECRWGDASYRGVIDLCQIYTHRAVVTDWKSQPNIISQSEFDDPFGSPTSEQFTFYCWLINKMYPEITGFVIRLWFLRYGFYIESRRTERDLEVFEEILQLREQKLLEIASWDPVPGKHCQYCDYIRRCPLAKDLSPEAVQIASQEQAIVSAQRVTVMGALLKELTSGLKEYVEANDDVRIGDNWVYGYHLQESTYWDPSDVIELLEDYGFDPSDVLRVDVRAMRKLIKDAAQVNRPLADRLEEVARTRRSTVFKGVTRKEK